MFVAIQILFTAKKLSNIISKSQSRKKVTERIIKFILRVTGVKTLRLI
jgi:hypothetical protein